MGNKSSMGGNSDPRCGNTVYISRENGAAFQGKLLKARTMLQIPQYREEVEAGEREKMRIHKHTTNKATQTSW